MGFKNVILKKRIVEKKLVIGSWLQIPNVFTAEIMAKSGFDWLAIDMEHGLIDLASAYNLIQTVELAGTVPLVRLNDNNPSTIRRVMDAGAAGVIIPMINSPREARGAVESVKYPPLGRRSYGLGRAHQFGENFQNYTKSINNASIVILQIEHILAVNNLSEILKVKGIDGIIIGPYDLSGSIGIPGRFDDKEFKKIIREIIEKVQDSNIALGIHIVHPSEKTLKERISQGFRLIGYGMDTIYLSDYARKALQDIKKSK